MVEKAVRISDQTIEENKGLYELERAELSSRAGIEDIIDPATMPAKARAAGMGVDRGKRNDREERERTIGYGLWRFSSPCY